MLASHRRTILKHDPGGVTTQTEPDYSPIHNVPLPIRVEIGWKEINQKRNVLGRSSYREIRCVSQLGAFWGLWIVNNLAVRTDRS